MKTGGCNGGSVILIGKGKNAMRHHQRRIPTKDDFITNEEDQIDTRLTAEELKKPLKAKGVMEKVASKLDKLKIKPIVQTSTTKRKKKPIVLEL